MSSTINVDNIGENTSGSGVTIDGVLLKDGSINGLITEYDYWRTTANTTGNTTTITAWGRPSGTLQAAQKGTGMSVTSGIWTFPSTGVWKVHFTGAFVAAGGDNYVEILFYTSDDNFATEDLVGRSGDGNTGSNGGGAALSIQAILDITDTTNDKIELKVDSVGSNSYLRGDSSTDYTSLSFMRLGDT